MLDLRDLEFDGVWIAVRCEPINDRASGITESQQFSHFVERFSGSIVARVANICISPEVFFVPFLKLGEVEMRVAARDNQRENGELEGGIFALPLLEQHGMNVSLKMIDRD